MDQGLNNSSGTSRPDVMNNMSETQMEELERAFNESPESYFDELGHSYGWSDDQVQQVRDHFSERIRGGQSGADSAQAQ